MSGSESTPPQHAFLDEQGVKYIAEACDRKYKDYMPWYATENYYGDKNYKSSPV